MTVWRLLHFVATFALGIGLGLYLTPIVRKGALRFGVLDHPDGKLKRQREPVPYLGGVAVYLAFLVTLGFVFDFEAKLLGLLLGGTIVAMVGLFDDLKVLTPGLKLMGQLLAALVLIKSGVAIELELLPAYVALPLSVAWMVGVTNAVNLLDVSDGLAVSTSAVSAIALAAIALLNGDALIATTAIALAGSLLGFLQLNRPPARIYLGDTGSLFVGFMLAALSMIGAYTRENVVGALAPLAILFVPLFETSFLSIMRLARGMAPWRGSGDHFALRLKARGYGAATVAALGAGCAGLGAVAALVMVQGSRSLALGVAAALAALAVALMLVLWWRYPAPH